MPQEILQVPSGQRSEMQDESRPIHEMWRYVFQALPDNTFLFDVEGHLVFANVKSATLQPWADKSKADRMCCDMFWQTEEKRNCVVDRALNSGLKS